MLVCTTIGRQTDEGVQPDLVSMLVEYGVLGFTHEGGIDPTRTHDVGNDYIFALDYFQEGMQVEYSLEHEDSMEVQIIQLVHASTKKARDVKWSYGKRIQQFYLELEHL